MQNSHIHTHVQEGRWKRWTVNKQTPRYAIGKRGKKGMTEGEEGGKWRCRVHKQTHGGFLTAIWFCGSLTMQILYFKAERETERAREKKEKDVRGTRSAHVPGRTEVNYHNESWPIWGRPEDRGMEDGKIGGEDMKALCWGIHFQGYFCASSTWTDW